MTSEIQARHWAAARRADEEMREGTASSLLPLILIDGLAFAAAVALALTMPEAFDIAANVNASRVETATAASPGAVRYLEDGAVTVE